MFDLISVVSIAIFTILSLAYTRACDRLKGGRA